MPPRRQPVTSGDAPDCHAWTGRPLACSEGRPGAANSPTTHRTAALTTSTELAPPEMSVPSSVRNSGRQPCSLPQQGLTPREAPSLLQVHAEGTGTTALNRIERDPFGGSLIASVILVSSLMRTVCSVLFHSHIRSF